ncbi:hypothetical protein ABIC71_003056 [Herbaspirillum seropedicae]|uniref:hypothetical protein n=1 Tax=Herbaspirillum seropedicae TaxID=964 RepID=UPI00339220F0
MAIVVRTATASFFKSKMESKKECVECAQPIKLRAKRCNHCASYQSALRRYLQMIVLTTGFALTTLTIYLLPPVKEMIEPQKADIKVSVVDSDFKAISFMIANVGNQTAAITQVQLETKAESGYHSVHYLKSDIDHSLLDPGKAKIVKASNGYLVPEAVSHEVRQMLANQNIKLEESCELVIQYIQLSGTKFYKQFPFACRLIDRGDIKIPPEK